MLKKGGKNGSATKSMTAQETQHFKKYLLIN